MKRIALVLTLLLLAGLPCQAANRVAIADGNLTTAGTWGTADTTSLLISTSTGTTALTTGNLDSATFTPGAITVNGFLVRLGSRASGSPSNTITVTLRNSTDAVNVQACTINVSLLPASSTTNDEGGWFYCHFSSNSLLIAAKAYLIRATLSATTTAVSLCTNGTANNWQRILVTTTTGAPAAGDDMHISGWFDNAANPVTTLTTRAVTQNQTAATDYGSASTSNRVAALNISNGGTLSYGTTAATNYLLQLSGHLVVYKSGTLNIGTSGGGQIPRDSTATLQFDCAADLDFGLINRGTFNAYGLSRISGSNIPWVLLSADVAASATTINTVSQLSGKSGDTVIVTASNGGTANSDSRTLNGDASASSFAITAGLTNAHSGTVPNVTEAFIVERNVVIKAVTDGLVSYFRSDPTGVTICDWVRFHAMGTNAQLTAGVSLNPSTGSATISNCVQDLADGVGLIVSNTATGAVSITWNVTYNCQSTTNAIMFQLHGAAGAVITVAHCVVANTRGSSWGMGIIGSGTGSSYSDIRISGITDIGVTIQDDHNNSTVTDLNIRPSGNGIIFSSVAVNNIAFSNLTIWKANDGLVFQIPTGNVIVDGGQIAGVGTSSNNACFRFDQGGPHGNLTFKNLRCAGTVATGTSYAVRFNVTSGVLSNLAMDNVTLGGSSPYTNIATGAISTSTSNNFVTGYANFASYGGVANDLATFPLRLGSWLGVAGPAAADAVYYTGAGTIAYSTSTCDVSPCAKLTPIVANLKLDSGGTTGTRRGRGFMVPVDNGIAITVSVLVQKDASYNGNQPRLILKSNGALGITETVLDTMTVGTGTYESLTGTTPAVTASGVLEFVVDCDGTAGNVYVDTWDADIGPSFNPMGLDYFYIGFPFLPWSVSVPAIGSGLVR